jgi:uncharacterized membrane protein (DUF2068 family)
MDSSRQPKTKTRAPTFYAIIAFKLLKGALFVTLAITAYALSDNNLPYEFQRLMNFSQPLMEFLKVTPANKFFVHIAESVGKLTESDLLWAALGTILYSSFSLVEGVGMIFRQSWAGWLAIGESAFFVPIEVYELTRPGRFTWGLFVILVLNVLIVWYLFKNRHRLFKHH